MRYLIDTNVCVMYLNGRSTSVNDHILIALSEYNFCRLTAKNC